MEIDPLTVPAAGCSTSVEHALAGAAFRSRLAHWCLYLLLGIACATPGAANCADKPVRLVTFGDHQQGSVDAWVQRKGFKLERDARQRDRIALAAGANGLLVETKRRAFGIMTNEGVNVPDFTYIEIDWGVSKQPEGASYERGVRNEALMLMVFMGDERQPSGSMLIPDSPFFVGLFLCSGGDKVNHPYVGTYFQKSGRYVCADKAPLGQLITSRFNLLEAYRSYFDKERDDDPGISGLALAIDTQKAGGGGTSSAFIREIRFFR
jgi:hypothetical protein